MKPARILRYGIAAATVAFLLVLALRPVPQLVDVETIDVGTVRESFEAEGRTRVHDRYLLTAPIAAQARRILYAPGDRVQAGQVLVVLDPVAAPALDARSRAEAEARVAAASARVSAAKALAEAAAGLAEQAANESKRLDALGERGLASREQVERAATERRRAEREAASARFAQATAEHELAAARAVLQYGGRADAALEVVAPISGVVLRRAFESGRTVQPGEALLEIGDPEALEVEVEVLSGDAVRLREGMAVELGRWGGGEELSGRVRRVEPSAFTKVSALGVEEQRVLVYVDLTSPRELWERLGDAYRVNARFVLAEAEAVLRLPQSALFQHEGSLAAFRVQDGRARLVPVEVGLRGGLRAELRRGLSEGDTVIVHPDRDLADGDRVRLR
jgi:HlyD family secretion protein